MCSPTSNSVVIFLNHLSLIKQFKNDNKKNEYEKNYIKCQLIKITNREIIIAFYFAINSTCVGVTPQQ